MNRRNFVRSWGRKLFFGISWPLSMALATLYLRSFIFPDSIFDWTYFITTFVAHFGLLNALFYFLLYCPVVQIFPTYYVSRLWSLILIIVLNLFIFTDALSFGTFGLHIYSYISKLLWHEGTHHLFGNKGLLILGAVTFIFSILVWIRGEMNWRYMQGRFSNPVSNWYLVLVFFFLMIGHGLYGLGFVGEKLSDLFPLNYTIKPEHQKLSQNRTFYYPKTKVICSGKKNPNIVLITLREWSDDQFNAETMPHTYHMLSHGIHFKSGGVRNLV